ncbi:MAG: ATP-binding protein [Betaproteobacteria bacterium]
MRLVPRSLFGRTLLVLAVGLLLAQAAGATLNLLDRGKAVYRLAATQIAARIAQNARILNRLPPGERRHVLESVDGQHLRVYLSDGFTALREGYTEHDRYEAAFRDTLRAQLGAPWPIRLEITSPPRAGGAPGVRSPASAFEAWFARHFYYLVPATFSVIAQIRLEDGSVAVFSAVVPQEPLRRLETLLPQLLLLVVACFALAAALVYMTTRPLGHLARAADQIGENPDGPDIADAGPSEIRKVIAAFNRMQRRVRAHLQERTRLLGAISHDLRTPITRLRLRTEMLADREAAARIQRDLDEMEAMVSSTLEFFRGSAAEPQRQPIDISALVESVADDRRDVGQKLSVTGAVQAPYPGNPQALRRCLDNLIENALRYGGGAAIELEDTPERLRVAVRDRGPGIPAAELDRVFEPFYRLESSRNPGTGGIGLGLSIARNIARWHGGDVELHNASEGGLVAAIVLPRHPGAARSAPT